MLGRDSEDEIWSRFVQELVIWPIERSDFGKKNSTLASIVPLAMFDMTTEKELLCIGKGTSDSNKKELSSPSVLQVFSWYEN